MIKGVLQDPRVRREIVYNMDTTGVTLNVLSSIKVLINKDDLCDYKAVGVKCI